MKRAGLQGLIFAAYLIGTLGLALFVLGAWAIYELYRARGWPADEPERSNCWAVALPRWLRDPEATYLVVSKSRHTFVPHVGFAESVDELIEYKPLRPRRGFRGVIDSFWFRGQLKTKRNG